jgi:hypothetical protein
VRFYVPGLDPESTLRDVAKVDFDVALSQATAFTDKFQRAMTTLSVVEVCVQKTLDTPNSKKSKSKKLASEDH